MIENVSIRNLKDGEFARWNEYVLGHADGTMFHLAGWADVFVESLGHKAHYKLAERDGKIMGLFEEQEPFTIGGLSFAMVGPYYEDLQKLFEEWEKSSDVAALKETR